MKGAFGTVGNSLKRTVMAGIDFATTVTGPIPLPSNVALRASMYMMDGKSAKGTCSISRKMHFYNLVKTL